MFRISQQNQFVCLESALADIFHSLYRNSLQQQPQKLLPLPVCVFFCPLLQSLFLLLISFSAVLLCAFWKVTIKGPQLSQQAYTGSELQPQQALCLVCQHRWPGGFMWLSTEREREAGRKVFFWSPLVYGQSACEYGCTVFELLLYSPSV